MGVFFKALLAANFLIANVSFDRGSVPILDYQVLQFSVLHTVIGGQVFKLSVLRGVSSRLLIKYVARKIELINEVIQGIG